MINQIETYMFTREVPEELRASLYKFICLYKKEGLTPFVAIYYYKFILKSYCCERSMRYSLSMIAAILNQERCPTNLLVNIYAHSLYCLALYDGQKIYEDFVL